MNLIKFLIICTIMVSIRADLDQNGKIIANSPIKASDMTTRFSQITSALTNRNLPLPNQSISSYNIGDTVSSVQLISDFNKLPSFLELSAPVFSSTIFSTELNSAFDAAIAKINEGTISFEGQYTAPQGACNPCEGSCSVVSNLNLNSCEQLFNNIPTELSNDANCPSTLQQTISSPAGTNDKTNDLPVGTLSETYSCNEGETFATGTLTSVTCDGGFTEDNLSCVPSDPFANVHILGNGLNNTGDTSQIYPISDLISTTEISNFDFVNNGQFFVPVVNPRENVLSLQGFDINSGSLNSSLVIRKITGIGFVQGFSGSCQLFGKNSNGNVTRNQLYKSSSTSDSFTETECQQYASEIYGTNVNNLSFYTAEVTTGFSTVNYKIYYVNGQNILGLSEYKLADMVIKQNAGLSTSQSLYDINLQDILFGLTNNFNDVEVYGDFYAVPYNNGLFSISGGLSGTALNRPDQALAVTNSGTVLESGNFMDKSFYYTTNNILAALYPQYTILTDTGCFLTNYPYNNNVLDTNMNALSLMKIVKEDTNTGSLTEQISFNECLEIKEVFNVLLNDLLVPNIRNNNLLNDNLLNFDNFNLY